MKMDRDFENTLNTLRVKYGEGFEYLNGFHESQLDFSDFINGFVDEKVADITIDANANASHKDIVSMNKEKSKPHDKLFAFNKIFYEIKKKYGLKTARMWLESEYTGAFYLHDACSSTYIPYSYKGSETVIVRYKDSNPLLINMSDLYDLVDEEPVILSEKDQAYCKYTNDLIVQDSDGWVKVSRVIKKPRTNKFHFIKTTNGMTEVVTDNHPLITTNRGDVNASEATTDDILTTYEPDVEFGGETEIFVTNELLGKTDNDHILFFRGLPATEESFNCDGQVHYFGGYSHIQNRIPVNFDFGWLIGFILGDGTTTGSSIVITQNEGKMADHCIHILEKLGIGYTISEKPTLNRYRKIYSIGIRSRAFTDLVYTVFIEKGTSYTKHLNPNIFRFNKEFVRGIVGGLLDSDGTLSGANARRIHMRMTSRHLINQVCYLIRMFGYNTREQQPSIYRPYKDSRIVQSHYIYHVAVTPFKDREMFDSIKIRDYIDNFTTYAEGAHCRNSCYTIGYGDHHIANNIELSDDYEIDEYVYDITTETGHFICNGILSHNCYAYDLTRLATEGLFFLSNYNNQAPQHLTTFTDDVIEYISYMCNRSSGAVGIPNILIWTFYFWKHDVENGYYIKDPDYYIRQTFQKFIYRMNQPFLRTDQSAFVNVSIFDRNYVESLFGGVQYPDGTFVIDYVDELIEHQKVFMEVVSQVRSENMFTFPVLTYSLLYRDGKFVDEDFARWCSDHNVTWNDSNFFISGDVNTLSNCCRLLSDTSKLSAFINSIGGTALSIGSVKVNTINLMRIAYNNKTENGINVEGYLEELRETASLCCKTLDTIRHIITRNIQKGLLPNYQDGGVELDKQYCTIGILGLYEVIRTAGMTYTDEFNNIYYSDEGIEFASKIFEVLNDVKDNFTNDYSFNIESVPAERAAVILCQKDNELFELRDNPEFIYSNQWIPLSAKCTLKEKLHICSILDEKCSGGSIAHINLETNFPNNDVAWDMLNMIAQSGVIYFAFNTRINECKNHHGFVGTDICPVCGEPVFDTYQRIVGYLVPTRSYSKDRFREFTTRKWYKYAQEMKTMME